MVKKKSHAKITKKKIIKKKKSNVTHLIIGIIAIIIIVAISKYAGRYMEEPEIIIEPEYIEEVPFEPKSYETVSEPIEGKYDYTVGDYESDAVLSREPAYLVESVRCSYAQNIVELEITNPFDVPLKLYLDEVPMPTNQMLINVNGRKMFYMDCGEKTIIEPGETVICKQQGNMFLKPMKETFGNRPLNQLQIKVFGSSDLLWFDCPE